MITKGWKQSHSVCFVSCQKQHSFDIIMEQQLIKALWLVNADSRMYHCTTIVGQCFLFPEYMDKFNVFCASFSLFYLCND